MNDSEKKLGENTYNAPTHTTRQVVVGVRNTGTKNGSHNRQTFDLEAFLRRVCRKIAASV